MVPVLFTLISSYEICMATPVPVLFIVLFAHWTRESRGQDNERKLFLKFLFTIFNVNFEILKRS
jgi:hypothetical protein